MAKSNNMRTKSLTKHDAEVLSRSRSVMDGGYPELEKMRLSLRTADELRLAEAKKKRNRLKNKAARAQKRKSR